MPDLLADHYETFSLLVGTEGLRQRRRKIAAHYVAPLLPALVAGAFCVRLRAAAELLSGLAIFTSLLFGLLVLVYTAGLQVTGDARWGKTSAPAVVFSDLRANVTYACIVSLLLTTNIAVAAALISPPAGSTSPVTIPVIWSAIIIYLGAHLAYTLTLILKRLKTGFDQLTS